MRHLTRQRSSGTRSERVRCRRERRRVESGAGSLARPDGDDARLTDAVIGGVRAEGVAFFSGTTYHGERLMRISVSDWASDEDDVDRAVEALLRHARAAATPGSS